MRKDNTNSQKSKNAINRVEPCDDTLSGRGGLALFVRYLQNILLEKNIIEFFGGLRKSRKGLPVWEVFVQILCFFADGTSRHLVHFDRLKKDPAYAAVIETTPERLLSSHQVKRFFRSFNFTKALLFRRLLRRLFIWRLKQAKPNSVILGLDPMVLDNDEAQKREGVKPTYKKRKGFQPLQLTWGRLIVDALFRSGDKHSNHGKDAEKMVAAAVKMIREHYRPEVPILIRMDSGFFDHKLLSALEAMDLGFICAGKLYDDLRSLAEAAPAESWRRLRKGKVEWDWMEFGDRRGSWDKFRRAFYCRLAVDGSGQQRFEFARPDSAIYTNLGMGGAVDRKFYAAGEGHRLQAENIVTEYHSRGADELCHRSFKDFAPEEFPFKRFAANSAWYYMLLTAFFLFQTFQEDVGEEIVPISAYPTRTRRTIIDIAAKIVRHAGEVVLKIPRAIYDRLDFASLWALANAPPPIASV